MAPTFLDPSNPFPGLKIYLKVPECAQRFEAWRPNCTTAYYEFKLTCIKKQYQYQQHYRQYRHHRDPKGKFEKNPEIQNQNLFA